MVNNADRKSGHCLVGTDNRIWAIDHGICFHDEFKLRTVIWEFSDQAIEEHYLNDLAAVRDRLLDPSDSLSPDLKDAAQIGRVRGLGQAYDPVASSQATIQRLLRFGATIPGPLSDRTRLDSN